MDMQRRSVLLLLLAPLAGCTAAGAHESRNPVPPILRPGTHPVARLPMAIRSNVLSWHFEPKPTVATSVGTVAGFSFYVTRGHDGYGCLLGANRDGSIGICSPLREFRRTAMVEGVARPDYMTYVGLAPTGYTSIRYDGRTVRVQHDVFRFRRRWGRFPATLYGRALPPLHMQLGSAKPR